MAEPEKKRRLPILSSPSSPEEPPEEDRPPWHWSGIGAVATFLVWLPLAAIAAKLGANIADRAAAAGPAMPLSARLSIIGLQLTGFVVAAFAGGFLVGRFGGKAGAKEAAASGFVAAAIAWALAAASSGSAGAAPGTWAALLVLLGGVGSLAGFSGGRFGYRRRHPAERP